MRSSSMRSKMIPRRETHSKRKASGEATPSALPAKITEKEEDTAPSTSTSSDDGAKCQKFKNTLKGICSLENYVKERDQLGFRDYHRAMMRTTPFAHFVDSNHRAIFKMTLIEEIAHSFKGASNFQIGDKTLTFTVEDVAVILGLPCCGLRVPHY
ncbi:hypothetical protein Taro_042839, partial [Colocasia esculenta]|nr:hypothetical protein [Colocasia esculenta]